MKKDKTERVRLVNDRFRRPGLRRRHLNIDLYILQHRLGVLNFSDYKAPSFH